MESSHLTPCGMGDFKSAGFKKQAVGFASFSFSSLVSLSCPCPFSDAAAPLVRLKFKSSFPCDSSALQAPSPRFSCCRSSCPFSTPGWLKDFWRRLWVPCELFNWRAWLALALGLRRSSGEWGEGGLAEKLGSAWWSSAMSVAAVEDAGGEEGRKENSRAAEGNEEALSNSWRRQGSSFLRFLRARRDGRGRFSRSRRPWIFFEPAPRGRIQGERIQPARHPVPVRLLVKSFGAFSGNSSRSFRGVTFLFLLALLVHCLFAV
eukprot:GHVT01089719.1.p1 GENE.GHVT01089719.1~~GHVT01089719.1.p1  ORF type:complete len:262 (-),score=57.86 GHVT01089719.1:274-1059(-)